MCSKALAPVCPHSLVWSCFLRLSHQQTGVIFIGSGNVTFSDQIRFVHAFQLVRLGTPQWTRKEGKNDKGKEAYLGMRTCEVDILSACKISLYMLIRSLAG